MPNRQQSRWWYRNEEAKERLIKFVNDWDLGTEIHEEDDSVCLSWDNWIYDKMIDDLPLHDYAHIRTDEFCNYEYFVIGDEMFEGENKNPKPEHQFDQWYVYKYNNKYISLKRLMQMKDDYFKNRFRIYKDEAEEYNFLDWKEAKELLIGGGGFFKWLSERRM